MDPAYKMKFGAGEDADGKLGRIMKEKKRKKDLFLFFLLQAKLLTNVL